MPLNSRDTKVIPIGLCFDEKSGHNMNYGLLGEYLCMQPCNVNFAIYPGTSWRRSSQGGEPLGAVAARDLLAAAAADRSADALSAPVPLFAALGVGVGVVGGGCGRLPAEARSAVVASAPVPVLAAVRQL